MRFGELDVHSHSVDKPISRFLNSIDRVHLPVEQDFLPLRDSSHDDEEA
jgi:hypothetical protein